MKIVLNKKEVEVLKIYLNLDINETENKDEKKVLLDILNKIGVVLK